MLKQSRRRNGCTGICITGRIGEPQRSRSVPWITDWRNIRSERKRNADFESVERVRGRKMITWTKLESLWTQLVS